MRTPDQLADVGGLVIPGGESSVMDKLSRLFGLREPLVAPADDTPSQGSGGGRPDGRPFVTRIAPSAQLAPDALAGPRAWKEVAADLRYLPFLCSVAIALHTPRGRTVVLDGLAWIVAAWTLDALLQAIVGTSPLFWSLDALKRSSGGDGFCSAQELLAADRLGGVFGPPAEHLAHDLGLRGVDRVLHARAALAAQHQLRGGY